MGFFTKKISRRTGLPITQDDGLDADGYVTKDLKPFWQQVFNAALEETGSKYRAWAASDDAYHLSAKYLEQKYGQKTAAAAAALQRRMAE